MHRRTIIAGIISLVLIMVIAGTSHMIQAPGNTTARTGSGGIYRPLGLSEPAGQAELGAALPLSAPTKNGIVVGRDYKHDVSPPLRDIPPLPVGSGTHKEEANDNRSIPLYGHKDVPDPIVQRAMGPLAMPTPIITFEGINIDQGCGGCIPPDTNGEVGPNNYVQTVNSAVEVWNKTGTSLFGPVAINTLWTGFGGPCETRNDGDPVVMYDQIADRWLISQFTADPPYNECIAVSTTPDPTGAYHRYAFVLSAVNFEDYPKFGVWPDGYYMSANQFDNGTTYTGPRPFVFDRASMLQGLAATFQTTANSLGTTVGFFLPSDLDGATSPPAGSPNYFLSFGTPMPLFEFHVDWANPANTTFNNVTNVANAGFTELCPGNQSCVPQPGTTVGLDALADRSMFRLAYRNFGAHASLVGNFSVDVGGGQAGVRWYEIRNPGAGAAIFQEGSYAPNATSRWMGSGAMDRDGNLAVGFSASSSALFPSLVYAGRLAADPPGQLTQGETTLFSGLGSQTSTANRWGDYSNLTVDPTDDCTFWYTNEYNPTTGVSVWHTRIGSFKFPGCTGAQPSPTPGTTTPTNTPTDTSTPNPLATDTPAPLCGPNWSVVSSPNVFTNTNNLNGVAAVSATDVWAVGSYKNGTIDQTLVEQWDGSAWRVVPSPNVGTFANYLNGVAVVSSSDVWAVGLYGNGTGYQTLVEHWDGSAWSVVPSPNVGTIFNRLNGVAAVSASDVWAVGSYLNSTTQQTLVEHWDGSAWSVVNSPNVGTNSNHLNGVAAVSSSDVWAVGYYSNGTIDQTLVEQWDGSAWTVVPSPNVGTHDNHLNGVAAVSSSDVWAVGYYSNGTIDQTLVEHWDGSAWSVVNSPSSGTHTNILNGAASVSASDVWAVGYYSNGTIEQTLVEHWDGSAWTVVPSNNVGTHANVLNGAASVSASDVWAVGYYDLNGSFLDKTLVERYNPCPPTPTPSATPTACSIQFSDVPPGSTFYNYIRCMACRGIVNGYADGTFRPNNQVTRGQLSKIVSNSAGFNDPQDTQMFQDVPVGSTFFAFIGRLASRGYIGGYPCGGPGEPCGPDNLPYFRPNNNATRGQISKIDSNAAGFNDDPTGQQFEDVDVGSAFYTYTYRLVTRSVMSGYACGGDGEPCIPPDNLPYFRPNRNATRGQTSKIVANTFFPNCQTPARR